MVPDFLAAISTVLCTFTSPHAYIDDHFIITRSLQDTDAPYSTSPLRRGCLCFSVLEHFHPSISFEGLYSGATCSINDCIFRVQMTKRWTTPVCKFEERDSAQRCGQGLRRTQRLATVRSSCHPGVWKDKQKEWYCLLFDRRELHRRITWEGPSDRSWGFSRE